MSEHPPGRSVLTMSITPFTPSGAIDERALRSHLAHLADSGVGIYLCSQGSGEGDFLTDDEKVRVFRIAVDEVGERCPVYAAGVGLGSSTAQILDVAQAAEGAGVHAVQVLGARPGGAPLHPGEVEAYFDEVVGGLRGAVHLSTNTYLTGYPIPVALIATLVERHPHITAINVTDLNLATMNRTLLELAALLPRPVGIRTGATGALPLIATHGGDGFLSFEANVAPQVARAAWDELTGRTSDASAAFSQLLHLGALLSRWPNPRSLKDGLTLLGRDGGRLRPPYQHLSSDELDELRHGLDAVGLRTVQH